MKPIDFLVTAIEDFAASRGLRRDAFAALATASDWESVLKASAIIESVLNAELSRHVPPEWREWFIRRVPVDTKRQLALRKGMLERRTAGAIEALARLRNRVVHDVEGFNLDLEAFVASEEGREFVEAAEWIIVPLGLRASERPSETHRMIIMNSPKLVCMMIGLVGAMELEINSRIQRGKGLFYPEAAGSTEPWTGDNEESPLKNWLLQERKDRD